MLTTGTCDTKKQCYQLHHDSEQHQHPPARRCCGGEGLPWLWRSSSSAPKRLAESLALHLHGSVSLSWYLDV